MLILYENFFILKYKQYLICKKYGKDFHILILKDTDDTLKIARDSGKFENAGKEGIK